MRSALTLSLLTALMMPGAVSAQTDPDTALWNAVANSNSVEDLQVYLKQFADGKHVQQARARIISLRAEDSMADHKAWEQSQSPQTADSLRAYIGAFPNGLYAPLARGRLARLFDTPAAAATPAQPAPAIAPAPAVVTVADAAPSAEAPPAAAVPVPAPATDAAPVAAATAPAAEAAPVARPRDENIRAGRSFQDCPDCPTMVWLPPGSFVMGSNDGPENERPAHPVRIGYPLAVSSTEVTRAQFAAFAHDTQHETGGRCEVKSNFGDALLGKSDDHDMRASWVAPGFQQKDNEPVVCIGWETANAYVKWLNQRTGLSYRLLTEAEWEYAARAGSAARWPWGDGTGQQCEYANGADLTLRKADNWQRKSVVTECTDGYLDTAPVASFKPNAFGLYDMVGNVWEWTQDCMHPNYNGAPDDGRAWPNEQKCHYVYRGGDFTSHGAKLQVSRREAGSLHYRNNSIGLRVARTAATPEQWADTAAREQQWRWQRAEKAGDTAIVERFLADYPDSVQRDAARQRLAQLKAIPTLRDRLADGSEGPVMVIVPPGDVSIGTPAQSMVQVHIGNAFAIGKYEVTVAEYFRCVKDNACPRPRWQAKVKYVGDEEELAAYWTRGATLNGDSYPITGISWNDAHAYIAWLNTNKQDKSGQYRLPSNSEWTYAAWAGSNATWPHGEDKSQLKRYAWFTRTPYVREVGTLEANAFGLHDMLGNVIEWVEDCEHPVAATPLDGSAAMAQCGANPKHIYRGGWVRTEETFWPRLRNLREGFPQHEKTSAIGFRVARTLR